MTITQFKELVLDYMSREAGVYDVDSVTKIDKVLNAANLAKLYAQRQCSFELAKTSLKLSVARDGSSLLTTATPLAGGSAVGVRRVIDAFLLDGSVYRPIRVVSKEQITSKATQSVPRDSTIISSSFNCETYFFRWGQNVGLDPFPSSESPVMVYLDVVQWMPAYSGAVTTDFFLEECQDWMLFRTIQILNSFLKEDRRVQITAAIVDDAWRSVVQWNESLTFGKGDLDI